jgi:glycosidase
MRPRLRLLAGAVLLLVGGAAPQPLVTLDTTGGDAWTFAKHVSGTAAPDQCDEVRLSAGSRALIVRPVAGRFEAVIDLDSGRNEVLAQCLHGEDPRGAPAHQDWMVRLRDRPEARIDVSVSGGVIRLDAGGSTAAPGRPAPIVDYEWRPRGGNPANLRGLPAHGAHIALRAPAEDGEYYVTLRVIDEFGRADETTTMVRVRGGVAAPVDPLRDHAAWIDRAVVYGVPPALFGPGGFADVTAALPRLASLGVNALWLSPITAASPGDFGYAVADEFRIDPRWGSAADLRRLVEAAHARNMRVILDLVANHLSDHSAYFQDTARLGQRSAYFGYFARDAAGAAAHYFDWQNLENLNYADPEVRRMITEASARWVRDFDVDGFRVDAAWGPRQRNPDFWPQWARALKRIKPDILLLAEAAADDPYYYANGFAAAYDWTEKLGEWAWRRPFDDAAHTVRDLRALIGRGSGRGLRFRFLDNNDTGARFVSRYGVERTRVAAAMLLTLPGMPALYAGDEVGAEFEPYRQSAPIDWQDRFQLEAWYRRLLTLRARYPALRSPQLELLDAGQSDRVLAYLRRASDGSGATLVLLNYGAEPARIRLPAQVRQDLGSGPLVDVLSGETVRDISLSGYGVRILAASPAGRS